MRTARRRRHAGKRVRPAAKTAPKTQHPEGLPVAAAAAQTRICCISAGTAE